MAKIYNSDLTKELTEGAKIQVATEKIPVDLAQQVVPVMEVNPKLLRICNVIKGTASVNSTSNAIFTTDSEKDFYVTHVILTTIKDATSESTLSRVMAYVDGVSSPLVQLGSLTLTAQSETVQLAFSTPIKLDRNTAVTVTNTSAVANITSIGTVGGFYVNNIKA